MTKNINFRHSKPEIALAISASMTKNIIFRRLKPEIALAIPASNDEKY